MQNFHSIIHVNLFYTMEISHTHTLHKYTKYIHRTIHPHIDTKQICMKKTHLHRFTRKYSSVRCNFTSHRLPLGTSIIPWEHKLSPLNLEDKKRLSSSRRIFALSRIYLTSFRSSFKPLNPLKWKVVRFNDRHFGTSS